MEHLKNMVLVVTHVLAEEIRIDSIVGKLAVGTEPAPVADVVIFAWVNFCVVGILALFPAGTGSTQEKLANFLAQ